MTADEKLLILKNDLQLLTTANDNYLRMLITQAEAAMETEGIRMIENDIACDMAAVQYAAYLFRKRASADTAMPRFLRWQLNNLLFSQKGWDGNDI